MGHYAETHDDCERVHDRRQRQAGFRAELNLAVVCTRSGGPGVHLCAGKDRRKYLLPCPCGRGVSHGFKGQPPRPHTLGESADAGAGYLARWPLGGRRFRANALHYALTRASAKGAFEQVCIRRYAVEVRIPGLQAAPRLSYRPIPQRDTRAPKTRPHKYVENSQNFDSRFPCPRDCPGHVAQTRHSNHVTASGRISLRLRHPTGTQRADRAAPTPTGRDSGQPPRYR